MSNTGDQLSGTELDYKFAKLAGFEILGWEGGPFVILGDDRKTIFVLGDALVIERASFSTEGAHAAMKEAQDLGASFRVDGTQAICEIGEVVAVGKNFAEAAMRCFIALPRERAIRVESAASLNVGASHE